MPEKPQETLADQKLSSQVEAAMVEPAAARLGVAFLVIKANLERLAPSHDAIECKAEGHLELALQGVELAMELLGEEIPE